MSNLFRFLMFFLSVLAAVNGCTAEKQIPVIDSEPQNTVTDQAIIFIDPEHLFQRIDGFGAFGSQDVPWGRNRDTYSSRFINDTLQNLGLTITRTQVPTNLEIQNDNQRSGGDQNKQYSQFTTVLDADGIAYADPGKLDLRGFNLDRFPPPRSAIAGDRPLIYEAEYLAALSRRASELNIPLKIIASIWSPPWWMKYVPAYFGTNSYWNRLSDGIQGDLPRMHEEFAEYCVAYIKLLESLSRPTDGIVGEGLHLYAFSPQNEPAFAQRFASAVYSPEQYKKMLKVVGRRFSQERSHWLATIDPNSSAYKPPDQRDDLDFFPDVKIFGPEDVSSFSRIYRYLNAVLSDQETRDYLDIVAIHGYGDDGISAGGSAQLWQDTFQIARRYNKPIWQTETSGYGPSWYGSSDSSSALSLARSIHHALVDGNASAWLYWALSDNKNSKFGLTAHGHPVSTYFVSSHFYRFIRPGSIRLAATSSDPNLLVSAFYHPDAETLTLILINLNTLPSSAKLQMNNQKSIPAKIFKKYVTTRKKDMLEEDTSAINHLSLEPLSVTTLYANNFPLTVDLSQMDFRKHPQDAYVTSGNPAEFEAILNSPYPWDFDFQWEIAKSENSTWQPVGLNIPYFRINKTSKNHDQLRVRLKLIDKENSERTSLSREATLKVNPFIGIEIPKKYDEYSWSKKQSLDNVLHGDAHDITHSASAQLAWDKTYLYLYVEVKKMTPTDSTDSPWVGDGIELYLDTQNNKKQTYGPNHYQWFIGHTDTGNISVETGHYSARLDLNSIHGNSKVTPEKWQIDVKIPWDELEVDPRPGMYLGYDIHLIDGYSSGKKRKSKLALFAEQDDSWHNPSHFGTLRLGL